MRASLSVDLVVQTFGDRRRLLLLWAFLFSLNFLFTHDVSITRHGIITYFLWVVLNDFFFLCVVCISYHVRGGKEKMKEVAYARQAGFKTFILCQHTQKS